MIPSHSVRSVDRCRSIVVFALRHGWSLVLFATIILLISLRPAAAQEADTKPSVKIEAFRLGFANYVKAGCWHPISIDIVSKGIDVAGTLEIATPDGDGIATSILVDNVAIRADATTTVRHFVKTAGEYPELEITLRDAEGRTVARRRFADTASTLISLPRYCESIVVLGPATGLKTLSDEDHASPFHQVVPVTSVAELPSQWFAYQSADVVVITSDASEILDGFDPVRASALATWVRHGGRLVVSASANWQVLSQSFLGQMLPAQVVGTDMAMRLSPQVRKLDNVADDKYPFEVPEKGMMVATLTDVRGMPFPRTGSQEDNSQIAVRGLYGFGAVTLLAFDAGAAPFVQWPGRTEFWYKLLELIRAPEDDEFQTGWSSMYYEPDLGSWIDSDLNYFPEVTVVSFGWVALLIFGYILLIGPIDYFLLKRVVKRMEFTWITFPIWVIVVSVAAYFSAHWMKGDDLRLNRVEIVDVDTESQTLRGRSDVSIFSPVIGRYSVTTTPRLAAEGSWEELGMGRAPLDRLTAWKDRSTDYYYGQMASAGTFLWGAGYSFSSPEPIAVINAPIKVWSVKSFSSQWLARASNIVEADLRPGDVAQLEPDIVGTITNRLDVPLRDAILVFGDYAQSFGTIEPGDSAELTLKDRQPYATLLRDHRTGVDQPYYSGDGSGFDPERSAESFLVTLSFSSREKAGATDVRNYTLSEWSLENARRHGKAILLCRVDSAGGNLWINEAPAEDAEPSEMEGEERRITFLRILLEPNKP